MARACVKKVAFISSFPPRQCGIATFTSDLIKGIKLSANGMFEPLVLAMRFGNEHKYEAPVKFEIRENVKNDYMCAADYINFSHVDLVSVQHEFGLFGGEAGSYLNILLNRLNPPVITTLHTILDEPSQDYYKSLIDVCNASYKVITMNERSLDMLRDIYDVPRKKVELISHGIPDLPFVDSNYYKYKFGMEDRRTILTFGLLNQNKGIEVMLKAMPDIIEVEPTTLYVILGVTHPQVLKYEGESYRSSLQRLVNELGLQKHVIFHNRFVNDEELHNFLCAADVYVTPYLSKVQPSSGTLSYAVGTGKAVVSTPYWAATELLADGRGKLVPFNDHKKTAEAVIEILRNNSLFYSLRKKAYEYGRSRTWPEISKIYWKLFNEEQVPVRAAFRPITSVTEKISSIEVPEPSLVHLKRLTDDTGLIQHSNYIIPDRENGYCTDDNARALIAMARYYQQFSEPEALRLLDIYLSFLIYSQKDDGTVRNFMNYDRSWRKNEPSNDAFGRTLWALGTLIVNPPSPSYLSIAKDFFDKSAKNVKKLSLRSMAYSILGMCEYLTQFPGASDVKRQMLMTVDKLITLYKKNSRRDWQWFEDKVTYDNAVMPHALFAAGLTFADEKFIDIAEKTCEFLLSCTYENDHFSFVGNGGWYKRGGKKASFDQQPIEAASTVLMLKAAYDTTRNSEFLKIQRKAFDWFLGENELHVPLYDFRTKGCSDGLSSTGVNINQGGESAVSFLLSQLAAVESYTIIDKLETTQIEEMTRKPGLINEISTGGKTEKAPIEELT